jgi:hypothetical protein
MYCPSCRTEYREGFTTCADCDEALVEELSAEELLGESELEPLLRTPSGDAMSVVIDALEAAEIPYVLQAGTALALLDGERLLGSRPADWEARIWVPTGRIDDAKALLRELRRDGQVPA